MYKIQTYNNIAISGLEKFDRRGYQVSADFPDPDAILLRSHDLHKTSIADSVIAIGRAGAGVNNIPVSACTKRGIPVFNTPGANANAVKELVIAGMLLASRNICQAWDFSRQITGNDEDIAKQVEKGKKQFAGIELAGKTLGIIGLGAIGVLVANSANALGMNVIGCDPYISIERAWQLSSSVNISNKIEEVFSRADFISMHTPLNDETRNTINPERIRCLQEGVILLNFSRAGIVDDQAICAALDEGKIGAYVCDFPNNLIKNHPKVFALPHLGASTLEAEDHCAVMVVEQIKDYLENGNIINAVNFPNVSMPRTDGTRLAIANKNVPHMVANISKYLGDAEINIVDLLNKSRAEVAYTMIDVEGDVAKTVVDQIASVDGILAVRTL